MISVYLGDISEVIVIVYLSTMVKIQIDLDVHQWMSSYISVVESWSSMSHMWIV